MNTKPPFTLPEELKDQFEVEWFEVETYYYRVKSYRALYHVNTSWQKLFPDDDDDRRPGAPFVHQWQIFVNDYFRGRCDGWQGFNEWGWSDREFATLKEALTFLRESLKKKQVDLKKQVNDVANRLQRVKKDLKLLT